MKKPAEYPPMPLVQFAADEAFALRLDAEDPLARYRDQFHLPVGPDGSPLIYFSGNSLGLQPKGVEEAIRDELDDWARLGVRGHFEARRPWFSYHELFNETAAGIVGARSGEVVMMNSLTANLHLMMVSFYRPARERYKVLMEAGAFPSDRYAVESQVRFHGYDPGEAVIEVAPLPGEDTLRIEEIERLLAERGGEIALVLFGGVHYYTGQALDMGRIAAAARAVGCAVGFDLAHAAGNLALRLHDWDVDFAVWCGYKYLNGGPGSVGGCFVHERHSRRPGLPRFAGWWGNDPASRFEMPPLFVPQPGAAGWQLSNAPVLSMAACRISLDLFDRAGMPALRTKSELLTGYLEYLLDQIGGNRLAIITPRPPGERGCQLSIRVRGGAQTLAGSLEERGVVCDFRHPDVIRAAPVPFHNTFHEVWRFARLLEVAASP